jgi:hypothetical protein
VIIRSSPVTAQRSEDLAQLTEAEMSAAVDDVEACDRAP